MSNPETNHHYVFTITVTCLNEREVNKVKKGKQSVSSVVTQTITKAQEEAPFFGFAAEYI